MFTNLTYQALIAEIDRMNTKQIEAFINGQILSMTDQTRLEQLNAERLRR
tara:strand:+ start:1061 stop:1210 length:150 start_codon:yes stop_codon:yes gene_type:complete